MTIETKTNVPLSQLTTFQQEGVAPTVYEIHELDGLKKTLKEHPNALILGKGSNSLIYPEALTMPIIKLATDIVPLEVTGNSITASAGTTVHQLMQAQIENGLEDLEFMAGVPASLGGMVAMNFGCWGIEIAEKLEEVTVMDREGELHILSPKEFNFAYRYSNIQENGWVVISAKLSVREIESNKIKETIQKVIKQRLSTQPLKDKTFGSVFKNPPGKYAAQLLESAGFKGKRHEQVGFSDQHANFMINYTGGTIEMAKALIEMAIKAVEKEHKETLEPEVRLLP